MGLDTQLLLRAVDAVQDTPDLDGVVSALAQVLRSRFDLWNVSACSLRTLAPNVEILATWSVAESVLTAGTEVSASITPHISELLEQTSEGKAVHTAVGNDPESIIDFLLHQQGIREATLQAIHLDDSGMLFVVLGSGSDGLLPATPPAFFAGLAAGIRPRVLELTHLST
jgi:hypothetical protein